MAHDGLWALDQASVQCLLSCSLSTELLLLERRQAWLWHCGLLQQLRYFQA